LLCGVVSHVNLTTELGGITVRVGIVTRFIKKTTILPKHIEELFRLSTEGLDKNQKSEIKTLLSEYSDVFAQGDLDLGNFTHVNLTTELGGITVRVGIVTRFTEGLVSVPKVTFMVFPFKVRVNFSKSNLEAQVLCAETDPKIGVSRKTTILPKHIEELFRLSTEGLDKNQKSEIKTLLSAKVSRHSSINGKGKTSLTVTVFKAQ
jgi:hypothetical protein